MAEWAAPCRELKRLCIPQNSPSWMTQGMYQFRETRNTSESDLLGLGLVPAVGAGGPP